MFFLLAISYSQAIFAAYIRYGGFIIERNHSDRYFDSRGSKGLFKKRPNAACIAIVEKSRFQSHKIMYSKEQFIYLMEQKPAIAKHFKKTIGFSTRKFVAFLRKNIDQDPSCVSEIDIRNFLTFNLRTNTYPRVLKKFLSRSEDRYFALLHDRLSVHSIAMAEDLFESYIIRKYTDPLEEAEKTWQYDGYHKDRVMNIKEYVRQVQKFLTYYSYLGKMKNISLDQKGNAKQDQINQKSLLQNFNLDYRRDVRLERKFEKTDLKINEIYQGENFVHGISSKKSIFKPSQILKSDGKRSKWVREWDGLQEKYDIRMAILEKKEEKRFQLMEKKTSGRTSALSNYYKLQKIGKKNLSKKQRKKYIELKAEVKYGLRSKEITKKDKTLRFVKKSLKFYNIYGTDTIVDKYIDNTFNLTIKQLQPMRKKRYRAYRYSKALDGFFVMSTTIVGLALAPFTGGLSYLAANGIGVVTTGFFSVLTSVTRNDPIDTLIYRLGLRSVHTFTEGLVPIWALGNSFFTSIDDIRVAGHLDQNLVNLVRKKKNVIKVRPESLGRPFVLELLKDRIIYLSHYLIPIGKIHLLSNNLSSRQERYLSQIFARLIKVNLRMKEDLYKSAIRYEYLLKSGKVPDHMLYDISKQLSRYHKMKNIYSQKVYNENILMDKFYKLL